MVRCNHCKTTNLEGANFCGRCGHKLSGDFLATNQTTVLEALLNTHTPPPLKGKSVFHDNALLRLEVMGFGHRLVIPVHDRIVIGRQDYIRGVVPEVDLTPFDGYRHGVSRRHAEIERDGGYYLVLRDLGSSNGTFLNGERLSINPCYRISDGDEIRIGRVRMRAFFEV